ncbi:MAG: glycosyltransferase [Chitinophagales bacterium]|nr:glycosyltransferase [Chitinophagales bacterium]
MKFPFFSIIIPTFNRAHTIRVPIDSILNQTFTDWELIIVDDGSTDNTREIVESYGDSRIRYVWQENQERSAARNHGISLAQGEWVCFQDSDDQYLSEHLEVLYQGILDNPEYKVIKSSLIIFQHGSEIARTEVKSISRYDSFPYQNIQTTSFHYSIFSDFKFDERFFIAEDLHFLIKVGMKHPVKVLPNWTGIYNFDFYQSGGIGERYAINLVNQRLCLDDILSWNTQIILPYIRRKRCLNPILLLAGHFKRNQVLIPKAIFDNLVTFFRFPIAYSVTVFRIIYVKAGELTGLYSTKNRF